MPLSVVVVEDDPNYRSSLESFLGHTDGFRCAAAHGSAEALLGAQSADGERPWDLALVDLELPDMDGIELTRRLKARWPDLNVVILTSFEDPALILRAIAAGADGYVLKRAAVSELRAHLRAVAGGGSPLTADVARTLLELVRAGRIPDSEAPGPQRLGMTERERDVLRCLVRGLSYQKTADHLGVQIDTVRTHIRAIYRKLQVHSVAEAITRALRDGLV